MYEYNFSGISNDCNRPEISEIAAYVYFPCDGDRLSMVWDGYKDLLKFLCEIER